MKALFFNGSPRKNWNTHQLLEKAREGAADSGAQTELIHLYDYEFRGCVSCFACKLKGNKTNGLCAYRDQMHEILRKAQDADVMVFASPVYLHGMSAQMRAFLERLLFPVTSYTVDETGMRTRLLDKTIPTGLIYSMNNAADVMDEKQYPARLGVNGELLQIAYGYNEILFSNDTLQFDDYSRYQASLFNPSEKIYVHEHQFPLDLQKAYEMGKRLIRIAAEK